MPVSFKTTKDETIAIGMIVARAAKIASDAGLKIDCMSLSMDLCAVHANGCPMDFYRLLSADDSNFAHDVFGIRRHLDRSSGKLMDCFRPRFAV